MKGLSVWIWVIAGVVIGILMFTISLQFITYVTTAQEKEIARGSLDELATSINGVCNNRAGDVIVKTFDFPEKVTSVYSTTDIRNSPVGARTYGNKLCMLFSTEVICDNVNCDLEMEKISSSENLQSLLNQFLGRYGTNSFTVKIQKTDCGIAVLSQNSQTTCALSNTLT